MNVQRVRLLIWKEFLQLRRDPMLIRVVMLMPVIQLVMFGYVVAADVKNLQTAVVDLDHTPVSRRIDASFASSGYFDVTTRPTAESEVRGLMDRGEAQVVIVIEEGTQARLERGETVALGIVVDGSDSQVASVAAGYAASIAADFNQRRIDESGVAMAAPGIDARVRVEFNPTLAAVNTMIPGLIAAILMISISVVMSQAVVKERERGTLEQMFVTPITPGEYLTGKVVPYILLATIQAALVAVVGMFWFGVPFNGSLLVVAAGLALFMLTSLGMGLLISLISHTRHQAQQTVVFVMIPTMILSGFIFPVESMPAAMQPVASFIPLTWALKILRGAFVKGETFGNLAVPMLVLTAFGVVIFGAAVLATRRRMTE